ncbi:MAG: lipopolysaccharide heptosyltransferase I [Rhizobiales bacterium]|nr:lipopolysaccharide heptosyltransferase I [Hyphomicrobiales bacterium]
MRVLIVKLSSFGDVVHTFPALTDLKAARPDIEVDWLVEEGFAPIVALHPGVAAIHALAFRRLRKPATRWPRLASETWRLRAALRARRYDRVVDLQGLVKSALPARLAGPVSGYDAASAREPAATRLYARRFPVPKTMHAVERTRALLGAALGYPVPSGTGRYGIAADGPPDPALALPARYATVMHAASWVTKLWPEEHWRALLPAIAADGRGVVLPWGNAAEKARAERIAAGVPGAVVLPRVMAGAELAGVLAGAELAVGLDSGLMHLSAALGVPGVWLYGPTDPGLTGPYGDEQVVVRSGWPEAPCRRRTCTDTPGGDCCMRAIPVAEVAAAVTALAGR